MKETGTSVNPVPDGAGPHGATLAADQPAIRVTDVHKHFGGVTALGGVDLEVPRGQITALIGPNGAGKSSLFNAITGHTAPDQGSVQVMGEDIAGRSMWELARMGMGRTFQTPRGFESKTVLENMLVSSPERRETMLGSFVPRRSMTRRLKAQAMDVLERIGLAPLADRYYDELSAGQMHVLEIGRQLMREINILLLDEPTAGVVPTAQDKLGELLLDLRGSGITVLIVEHNLKFVFGLCSHVAVMVNGCIIRTGSPSEIQHDEAVIDAYIGRSGGDHA